MAETEALATYQALTKHLAQTKYTFICPSPETQGRVVSKRLSNPSTKYARSAEDFFGWNLPVTSETLSSLVRESLRKSLRTASIIVPGDDNEYRSTIRVSNFYTQNIPNDSPDAAPLYYIHSSFPAASDSVFFGPDTYLFTSFLRNATRHLPQPPSSLIDVCCGSGAGAIHMARTFPQAKALGLDLNPLALKLGGVNAQLAATDVKYFESNLYASVPDDMKSRGIDLIVSNPPYIASSAEGEDLPIYADGGAEFGLDISVRIVEEGSKIISPQGVIMVYTGVAIPVDRPGYDAFLDRLQNVKDVELVEYTVLHPDMWPEEIGRGAYANVGRIQAIGAVLKKKSSS